MHSYVLVFSLLTLVLVLFALIYLCFPKVSKTPRYIQGSSPREKEYPVEQARLDSFLISSTMADFENSSSVRSSYHSYHSVIEININLSQGYWKFNNNFIKNTEYFNYVTLIYEEEKLNYALYIYNMAHITANNCNIDFTISNDHF